MLLLFQWQIKGAGQRLRCGYLPRHHLPDTVGLAAAPRFRAAPSLQMALCSHTIFIVSAGGDGNRGVCFVALDSKTPVGGWDPSPPPPLRSCPHLLGGKAWISPFPPSLPLKRSLSPSHLAPLLSSPPPPGGPLCTPIKKAPCSSCAYLLTLSSDANPVSASRAKTPPARSPSLLPSSPKVLDE